MLEKGLQQDNGKEIKWVSGKTNKIIKCEI